MPDKKYFTSITMPDGVITWAKDEDLTAELNAEIERATEKENTLQSAITAESNRAESKEISIVSDLNAEIERATEKENTLQSAITAESNRAESKESSIFSDLNAEIERATEKENTLQSAITAESNRAESKESSIVSDLNSEIAQRLPIDGTSSVLLDTDVNDFLSGVALFQVGSANLPNTTDTFLILSGGDARTNVQIAFDIWNNISPQMRYRVAGSWNSWRALKLS